MHIKGLQSVWFGHSKDKKQVASIINKYLQSEERDVFLCQDDLLKVGFDEWAKL